MKIWIAAIAGLCLAGCSITEPVAVIGPGGDVLTGTATASLSSGTFSVANSALSCGGSYDPLDTATVMTFTVLCNDGRKGFGTAIRSASGLAGEGQVHLDDGATANFIFGTAAASFTPKVGKGLRP